MQANHIKEKNVGMDEDEIRKAISRVKLEDEEEHERNIEYMAQDDDYYKSPWKIKDATGLKAVTDSSDLDENPASRKEPITDTKTLKEPIKGSHLGKRVCHSECGSTNMDPVVTGLGIIGQGGPQAISRGSHTQSIIQGGENIVRSDVITHVLMNPRTYSFPFDPFKAQTLMVASLLKPFLISNGNVRSASIIGASHPDQSRIISPQMNKHISSRDDVRSTVRNDIGEADKLNAAVQRSLTDERNKASS